MGHFLPHFLVPKWASCLFIRLISFMSQQMPIEGKKQCNIAVTITISLTSNLFWRYAAIICKKSNLIGHQRMSLRIKITCHQNMNILVPRAGKLKNLLIPLINMECNPLGRALLPAAHRFYVQESIPLVCTQCVGTAFFPFLTVPKIHGSVARNWHTSTPYILISQISELLKKKPVQVKWKFASTYLKKYLWYFQSEGYYKAEK